MKNQYGLVGYPLIHSFSQKFFNQKFEREKMNAEYLNFEIQDIAELKNIVESNPGLKGLNVTIPYKEAVIPFLNDIDNTALQIGAVNVIKIFDSGNKRGLKGYNTDVIGFQDSIFSLLEKHHKKALILGTGGASKAVGQALHNLSIDYILVSRSKQKANTMLYSDIDETILREYSLIINTTPLGTFPKVEEYPPIPYQYLTRKHFLYDLVYNPHKTCFLRLGEEHRARIKNGEEMLILQALAAWKIWNQ